MTGTMLLAVAVSAAVTFALRALPFVLFRGTRRMPDWLERLGRLLPSAIMAVLIVYCLRGARSNFVGSGVPGLTAAAIVMLCYKKTHNTFFGIIAGTAVYMLLLRVIN